MERLTRYVPLVATLRDGYGAADARADVSAGLTTAVMLVPQAMAYAMLAGLPPIVGLYASLLPLVAYALVGTSRQLAVGPVAMVSLLVASGVGALAEPGSDTYLAMAVLLAVMVGVLQLVMGVARLGWLVNFLSHPVVSGFTSAAALLIALTQIKHILRIDMPRSHDVQEMVHHLVQGLPHTHGLTLLLGLSSMAGLLGLKRWAPRVPRFLVVVGVSTLATWGLGLHEQGIRILGAVPAGLPRPVMPTLDLGAMRGLLPMAATIAAVGFMESISVAKRFARDGGYELDANQELLGLGFANLGAALLGGYPVAGGFGRSAVNAQAGARTGVAPLVTAVVVAATLLFLTPLFTYLPDAVLAAIILTAVLGLVDVAEVRHLWRVSRSDAAILGITFLATLQLGIEPGIAVGVAASVAWFVWQTSKPHVAVLGRVPGTTSFRKLDRNPDAEPVPGVLIVRIDAPLYFANTAFLKSTLTALEEEHRGPLRAVVLNAKGIGQLDATAADALDEVRADYAARGIRFVLAGVRGPVHDVLTRSGFVARAGPDAFVLGVQEALEVLEGPQPERASA